MISIKIWLNQLKNNMVYFNHLLLLIKILCWHNRFNLYYNFIHIDTFSIVESNYIKLPQNKDNLNEGKNGLTIMLSKEELNSNFPFNKNDRKLMEYIDSVCSKMFSPWVPKILMDIFILTQHYEGYDFIKHVNQDCLHMIYFDPQKYPVSTYCKGIDMKSSVKIWQPQLSNRIIKL